MKKNQTISPIKSAAIAEIRPCAVLLLASLILGTGCQSRPAVKWGGLIVGQGEAVVFDPSKSGTPDFQIRFPDGSFKRPEEISKRAVMREITHNSSAHLPPWGGIYSKWFYRSGVLVGQISNWGPDIPDDLRLYFDNGALILNFEGTRLYWLETNADRGYDCKGVKPAIRNPRTGRVVELPAKGDELRALRTLFDVPEG